MKELFSQTNTDHDDAFFLQKLYSLVDAIAGTFGSRCEVVLHDLRQLDRSIVKIVNGHVTGRKVGGSITDLALRNLRENMVDDILLNYKTVTKDGRTLKSTTVLLRNKRNLPIGALCINFDITNLRRTCSELNEFCQIDEAAKEIKETFEGDITSTISSIIEKTITAYHKPAPAMQKEDRLMIVTELEEQGVFLIKGSVSVVAQKLNVSKYAIYNYLAEIRALK